LAEHIRLRAPQDHGQTLQIPSLSESRQVLDSNRSLLSNYSEYLQSIRAIARQEMRSLALQYTRQYSDVATSDSDSIVMSGHQPTLFHPGVWFKNFALDAAAKSAEPDEVTAINLVVDNDLCDDVSVLCPQKENETARLLRVPFDAAEVAMPFEMRQVKDSEVFDSFGSRLSNAIKDVVASPLIDSLWPEVQAVAKQFSLPASIAAGRHRLEQKHGLNTLELPVSVMSKSESFAMFVDRLATSAKCFVEVHNKALQEYRKVNRIRSRSHPVPELKNDGQFCEIPFWIWTSDDRNRRRLFVSTSGGMIELTDRAGWSKAFERTGFAASFQELNQLDSNVYIRPRALATTMFSRLFASDLFLHGIGGAKYDQLNDEIIRKFFEVAPPQFMTMTATMKLPIDFVAVTEKQITEMEVQLRRMRFHPELKFTDDEDANRKDWLIENAPTSNRKSWHDEIAAINENLFGRLEGVKKLQSQIAEAKSSLPTSKVFGSREFSFALFPEGLVGELGVSEY